jgi:hypothetical protein
MDNGPYSLGSGHDFDPTVIAPVNSSYVFSFYTAKLLNLTSLSFNETETGHDFYLEGYWNVSDITETINVTWTLSSGDSRSQYSRQITVTTTETPFAINENGTLVADWAAKSLGLLPSATGGWIHGSTAFGTFELSIDKVGTLSGYAMREFIWKTELNICDLGDANGIPQGKVDINDLVKVAQHYGEVPGFANYDPSLDLDGNGRIDIGDLTTIAANIQG